MTARCGAISWLERGRSGERIARSTDPPALQQRPARGGNACQRSAAAGAALFRRLVHHVSETVSRGSAGRLRTLVAHGGRG